MTRERAPLVRLLFMCLAWAAGQTLATLVAIDFADIVLPAALAIGVYVVTDDLGRPGFERGEGKYWRGRRIDDERPGRGRLN